MLQADVNILPATATQQTETGVWHFENSVKYKICYYFLTIYETGY